MFDLRMMLRERRLGFRMNEVMSGSHHFINDAGPPGEHPMSFEVEWGTRHLGTWLNPAGSNFMRNYLEGTVSVGGLVEQAHCHGTLELLYFSQAKIRYTFDFKDDNGTPFQYVGEKVNIRPWNLHRTHTTCYGTITNLDTGKDISKSILYFKLATLPGFAASFRLA
jgi:hypothetical protein